MSTKNYFMFTLFLLSSLSNVNAMNPSDGFEYDSEPTLSPNSTPKKNETTRQDLYYSGNEGSGDDENFSNLSDTPKKREPNLNDDAHFYADDSFMVPYERKETPKNQTSPLPEIEFERPRELITLTTILGPLSENLGSAGVRAHISCKPLDYINEYLNPDQKVIYKYFPENKLAEDYVIKGKSPQNEEMFSLYVTSLRAKHKLTEVIFWRGDRVQQTQFIKPATTGALATTTLMCVLNTLQETGVPMLATTGFLPTIVKEMEIPVLETAEVPRPTRVFRVNKGGNPLSASSISESPYGQREQQSLPVSLSESTVVQEGEFYNLLDLLK